MEPRRNGIRTPFQRQSSSALRDPRKASEGSLLYMVFWIIFAGGLAGLTIDDIYHSILEQQKAGVPTRLSATKRIADPKSSHILELLQEHPAYFHEVAKGRWVYSEVEKRSEYLVYEEGSSSRCRQTLLQEGRKNDKQISSSTETDAEELVAAEALVLLKKTVVVRCRKIDGGHQCSKMAMEGRKHCSYHLDKSWDKGSGKKNQ